MFNVINSSLLVLQLILVAKAILLISFFSNKKFKFLSLCFLSKMLFDYRFISVTESSYYS